MDKIKESSLKKVVLKPMIFLDPRLRGDDDCGGMK